MWCSYRVPASKIVTEDNVPEKAVASSKALPEHHRTVPIEQKQAVAQLAAREHQEKKQNLWEFQFIASTEQANALNELKQCNEQLNELMHLSDIDSGLSD